MYRRTFIQSIGACAAFLLGLRSVASEPTTKIVTDIVCSPEGHVISVVTEELPVSKVESRLRELDRNKHA